MKRPALIAIAILLLVFLSTYFIIPQKIKTTTSVDVDATDINVAKFLVNKRPWQKWWPGSFKQIDSSSYTYQGVVLNLGANTNSQMPMTITTDGRQINGKLTYLTTSEMSCKVSLETESQSSLNPFSRIGDYFYARKLSNKLSGILTGFKKFMQADINVYGMTVKIEKVKVPIVLATTVDTKIYPSAVVIYQQVDFLKQQLKADKAIQVDSPMVNVHQTDEGYQTMVAIPIDKVVKPGKNTVINKLVKDANLLTVQIKGGKNTIQNAFDQLKKYQKDHRLISPAMPYEVLLTNRANEPDTAKWVTKVHWPIF